MSYDLTTQSGTPAYTATSKFGAGALNSGVLQAPSGVDSFIGVTTGANIGTGTYECWFKSSYSSGTRVIMGHAGRFYLYVGSGQTVTLVYGSANITLSGATTANNGTFHHVAVVFNAGAPSLYYDGNLIASSATVGTIGSDSGIGFAIGGFNNNVAFNFAGTNGTVDETRISTVVRYSGSTYTTPTTAFAADGVTNGLYHLDNDGTDSATGGAVPPTMGIISVSSTGGFDTITYPAPGTGTNAVAGAELYVATASGAYSTAALSNAGTGGGTFTYASPSSGQNFYVVKGYDSAGFRGGQSNEVYTGSPTGTTKYFPNNAGIQYSPYTWDVTSGRALASPGAYFKTLIAGSPTSIILGFDVSVMANPASQISYRIDRLGGWITAPIAAMISLTIPSLSAGWPAHELEVVVKSSTETVDRWNSPYATAAKMIAIFATNGSSLVAPTAKPLRGLAFGDSITEGINTISAAGDTTVRSDTTLGWAYQLTELLSAEVGVVGFGRQGLTVTGNGNVPVFSSTYNKILDSITRAFTPVPDFIVLDMGTNDSRQGTGTTAFQSAYTAALNLLIAATPTQTLIFAKQPFGSYYTTSLYQNAIAACSTPSRVVFINTTGWWSTTDSPDAVHPYGYANQSKLGPMTATAIKAGLDRGSVFQNKSGTASPITIKRN